MNDETLMELFSCSDADDLPEFPPNYPPRSAWKKFGGRRNILRIWESSFSLFPNSPVAYVHFPFCPSECSFCGFYKKALNSRREIDMYLDALESEMSFFASVFKERELRFFCVGGGTPSMMNEVHMEKFFGMARSNFKITRKTKIAFEAAPSTLTEDKIKALNRHNVHWLAVGVQSFDDELMKKHNRKQDGKKAIEIIKKAKETGIKQIEIDLMCGLEGQTYGGFLEDVKKAADLDVERIYMFDFQPRRRCAFENKRGSLEGDEKEEARRFRREAADILVRRGYTMRCGHWVYKRRGNEWPYSYDQCEEGSYSILGLGPSAVSYAMGKARYQNACDEKEYEKSLEKGKLPVETFCALSKKDEMINFIFLEALHRGGVSRKEFKRRFGAQASDVFPGEFKSLLSKGVLAEIPSGYPVLKRETASFELKKEFYAKGVVRSLMEKYKPSKSPLADAVDSGICNPLFNRLPGKTYEFGLGGECDLNCIFCPNVMKRGGINRGRAAALMYRASANHENVMFSSGEPSACGDIGFLLALAKKIGFKKKIFLTNGMRLSDFRLCGELAARGLNSVIVKTASCDDKTNGKLFGEKRQLEFSLKTLENFRKLGVETAVCVVLTGIGLESLNDTLSCFKRRGEKNFILWFPRYTGNMRTNSEKIPGLSLTYSRAAERIKRIPKKILRGISLKTLNIPLCVLCPDHGFAADVLEENDKGDARESHHGDELLKMEFEYQCRFLLNCAGAASDYVKKYGLEEIKPIK